MAEGKDTLNGLGVPLFGNFEIKGRSTTLDIATLTHASGASGDYLVCQNSSGTEHLYIDSSGNIISAGTYLQLGGTSHIKFGTIYTTAPTTLAAGNLFLVQISTQLQIAIVNKSDDLMYVAVASAAI